MNLESITYRSKNMSSKVVEISPSWSESSTNRFYFSRGANKDLNGVYLYEDVVEKPKKRPLTKWDYADRALITSIVSIAISILCAIIGVIPEDSPINTFFYIVSIVSIIYLVLYLGAIVLQEQEEDYQFISKNKESRKFLAPRRKKGVMVTTHNVGVVIEGNPWVDKDHLRKYTWMKNNQTRIHAMEDAFDDPMEGPSLRYLIEELFRYRKDTGDYDKNPDVIDQFTDEIYKITDRVWKKNRARAKSVDDRALNAIKTARELSGSHHVEDINDEDGDDYDVKNIGNYLEDEDHLVMVHALESLKELYRKGHIGEALYRCNVKSIKGNFSDRRN